jgi:phospholipase C
VTPIRQDQFGLHFRVTTLIISPYSKPGYIDHTQYSFESMLKFIEWCFGIPAMTYRDASANNLLNAFDFDQRTLRPTHVVHLDRQEIESISPYMNLSVEED